MESTVRFKADTVQPSCLMNSVTHAILSMNSYTYFNDMPVSIKRRTPIEVQKSSGQSCEDVKDYYL